MGSLFTSACTAIKPCAFPPAASRTFSSTPQGARNAILWPLVAYPSNYKKKETAMFQKLMNTTADFVMTLLRLAVGVVFFAHGAQKALGLFSGYAFRCSLTCVPH